MKLELGSGYRPTIGYEHNDIHPFPHIEHVGEAWMLELPDNSVDEVLALAFIEHLTHDHAMDTFRNVYRMLKKGGEFYFDVPNYPIWAQYYLDALAEKPTPVPMSRIKQTLFGWQRWPGDEHNWGWDMWSIHDALMGVGFNWWGRNSLLVENFTKKGLYRNRFHNPADAHLYVGVAK